MFVERMDASSGQFAAILVRKEERMLFLHRGPLSDLYFGSECSDLQFLIHGVFQRCHCSGKGHPFSPSPSMFCMSRHVTHLLCDVNEGTACGLGGAPFCERQREKNLGQRTFYYKTRSFSKTVNMMNFSLQLDL